MPPYKRQHFPPCACLKNFSPDGIKATRDSKVWRVDQTRSVFVPVESQCFGDYLYSKQEPEKSEKEFQAIEQGYASALAKIWTEGEPTVFEYFALIFATFDLYTRNIAHENLTGLEGVQAYNLRTLTMLNRLVVGNFASDALAPAEMKARLMKWWGVRLFRTPGGEIATSDHPTLCFNWGKTSSIDFILRPLTPTVCAAVFDKRTTRTLGSMLTADDGIALFDALVAHCNSCIYTSGEPDQGAVEAFRTIYQRRSPPRTTTDPEKWSLELITPLPETFSFVRPLNSADPRQSTAGPSESSR